MVLAYSQDELDQCKNAEHPLNCLLEVGTAKSPNRVGKEEAKKFKKLVLIFCRQFQERMPGKPECKVGYEKLDAEHKFKLSQARIVKKDPLTPVKHQVQEWAKAHGENLHRLLMWCWRAKGRSDASYDPDIQEIKGALNGERQRMREATAGSGPKDKKSKYSLFELLQKKKATSAAAASGEAAAAASGEAAPAAEAAAAAASGEAAAPAAASGEGAAAASGEAAAPAAAVAAAAASGEAAAPAPAPAAAVAAGAEQPREKLRRMNAQEDLGPAAASSSCPQQSTSAAPEVIELDSDVEMDVFSVDSFVLEEDLEEIMLKTGDLPLPKPQPPAGLAAALEAAATAPKLMPGSQRKKPANQKKPKGAKKGNKQMRHPNKMIPRQKLWIGVWRWVREKVRKRPAAAVAPPASSTAAEPSAASEAVWIAQAEHPTNFAELPPEAHPAQGVRTGKHSYSKPTSKGCNICVRVRDHGSASGKS